MVFVYYRGYILIRLKSLGTEWNVVEKLSGLSSTDPQDEWRITYITPIYGSWDVIVECSFTKLQDLDKIVAYCKMDDVLKQIIEETTTLMGTKKDYL